MKKSLILVGMLASTLYFAQVTSSEITGTVKDDANHPIASSTVTVIHVPSGTKYTTKTNAQGIFNLPDVRVGGPYKVIVTAVGHKEAEQDDIYTTLGNSSSINLIMGDTKTQSIEGIVLKGNKKGPINPNATGAALTYDATSINRTPTITRSINDVTKYNPYSNGNSFGGQDSRFNSFTIDGSVFNNGFGLGNQAQAGGRTGYGAISLDAIQEIQVNVAPYDVKQSGFAGGAINAVTRSGTNEFAGSYYSFWNNSDLAGKKAYGVRIPNVAFSNTTNGFRLGGPIIKNKLFFFTNIEWAEGTQPALKFVANGHSGVQAATKATDLESLSSFMKQYLNYDLGAIDNYNQDSKSRIYLGRIDWNINDHNKLSVRYSHHDSSSYQLGSNSNSSGTAGYGNRNNLLTAISGQNTGYNIQDNTRSISLELNSQINSKISNQFLTTYNKQIEDRAYRTAGIFPTIDILNPATGQTYTSVGMDPFTPNNRLNYYTLNFTDNLKVLLGRHTLTAGLSYERFNSNNLFFYASNGVWTYNGIQDFRNAVLSYLGKPLEGGTTSAPNAVRFNYRYSLLPNGELPWQNFKVNTYSFYLQDSYKATDNFRIYLGARLDYIDIPNTAKSYSNPIVAGMTFYKPDGSPYKVDTGTMPKGHLYISPRLGFNWDVNNDKQTQIRGGSGIFLSRLPYVLISNQLGNNGVNIGSINEDNTSTRPFTLDPTRYIPPTLSTNTKYDINYTDPNIKFPQVWKTSLALDQKIDVLGGIVATVEGIYNKNINALYYYNANLKPSAANYKGADTRPYYPALDQTGSANITNARYYNKDIGNVYVLDNTKKGHFYSLTAKIEKPVTKAWGGMIGYTYSKAYDMASVGSTVNVNIPSVNGVNYLNEAFGDNDLRHNIVGTLSYKFAYGTGLFGGATTISIGMFARSGSKYSYTISGDMNADTQNGNDLLYIPKSASEITFVDITKPNPAYNAVTNPSVPKTLIVYTAAQQAEAFDQFINNDKYLSSRRGQYAERNAASLPWLTRFDLSIAQDFTIRFNNESKPNNFQIRLDILNVGNLINNKWGVSQSVVNSAPLVFKGKDANGKPTYTLATQVDQSTNQNILLRDSFQRNATINDVYQIQIGLRYTFNK